MSEEEAVSPEELLEQVDELVAQKAGEAEAEEEEGLQDQSYRATGALRVGNRIAGVSPDGLRRKVLDAVPEWETWPRKLRQMFILLPTHGRDLEEIAESVGLRPNKLDEYRQKFPEFFVYVNDYWDTGHYPEQRTPMFAKGRKKRGQKRPTGQYSRGPVAHAHLVQHYANESAVLALLRLESGLKASDASKIVDKAGWFSNIESDTEKHRANFRGRIEDMTERIGRWRSGSKNSGVYSEDEEAPAALPKFEQDIDPDGGFDGVTEAAK